LGQPELGQPHVKLWKVSDDDERKQKHHKEAWNRSGYLIEWSIEYTLDNEQVQAERGRKHAYGQIDRKNNTQMQQIYSEDFCYGSHNRPEDKYG
jgi:hypothetical protein